MVKSKGGPRPPEGVKTMRTRGNISTYEDVLEDVSNVCINNGPMGW